MKKLEGPLDVKFINKTFFPEYQDVSVINQGECFLWAYIAFHLYENLELWSMGAHAFVRSKLDKKFYDSERPKGEENWKDLPATNFGVGCGCNICSQGARKHISIKKYQHTWRGMAKRHNTDWNLVDLKIKQVIEENQ